MEGRAVVGAVGALVGVVVQEKKQKRGSPMMVVGARVVHRVIACRPTSVKGKLKSITNPML